MASPTSEDKATYKYKGWRFPTLSSVYKAHDRALREADGEPGIRDINVILTSISKPVQSAGGEDAYADFFDKVVSVGWHFAYYQGFVDGNKRTGLLLTEAVLEMNGYSLHMLDQNGRKLLFSLVGAGYLKQDGLKHALLIGCGMNPVQYAAEVSEQAAV